jgi:hypothetical protein
VEQEGSPGTAQILPHSEQANAAMGVACPTDPFEDRELQRVPVVADPTLQGWILEEAPADANAPISDSARESRIVARFEKSDACERTNLGLAVLRRILRQLAEQLRDDWGQVAAGKVGGSKVVEGMVGDPFCLRSADEVSHGENHLGVGA